MPNWTRKWSPGDSLNNVSSEFMNLLIDVVRDWLRRKGTQPGKVITPTENTVYVKNESSVNLDQFSIVRVGDDLVAPTEDDDSFFGKVAFKRFRAPEPPHLYIAAPPVAFMAVGVG